jgi:uracil-DNA glycosylase
MSKSDQIKCLNKKISKDLKLPFLESNLVLGDGCLDASVLFVGEAPGAKENEIGKPFVGRAGSLLMKSIETINLKREDVYITNIVKRRPPENRDPSPEEIFSYKKYSEKEIDIINPVIVVPLGRFAGSCFLEDIKISRDQGRVFIVGNRKIYPVFHPAATFRNLQVAKDFKKSILNLKSLINS